MESQYWGDRLARRQNAANDRQLRQYLGTLTPAERRRYLDGLREVNNPAPQPAPQNAQNAPGGQQAPQQVQENHFHIPRPYVDPRLPLERMIDRTEEAFRDENDSRRLQAREGRMMQHSKELEAMRQEGLIQRLAAQQDAYRPYAMPQAPGGMRVWNPETQSWEEAGDRVQFG